ncbi:hypothetical protein V6Z11_A05G428400 [Gossypium hirsutum]
MMKGCKFNILKGIHVSIALLTLCFLVIMLSPWKNNPFLTTLLLAQQRFRQPSSDLLVDAPNNSSISRSRGGHTEEANKSFLKKEATRMGEHHNSSSSTEPVTTFSSEDNDSDEEELSPQNADCNFAKGRWVADSKRPLYSGFGCKQWLSVMWACRLTQRTDFSFEGYRWQPKNCKMKKFNRFSFLRRMRNKTIAFVGDSLGRQQFQSMMCMVSGGEHIIYVEDAAREYGLVKPRGAKRPDGWVYRFTKTNTTILYYWSASLSDLVPINSTDKASDVAMHLDRPPAFLRLYLHRFDVLVLNTGHHWNRGKFEGNNKEFEDIRNAKNFTVHSFVRWLDSQLTSHPRLKAFFRTISPRHYRNGDWNTGGTCNNTIPLTNGSEVLQDGSNDKVVESAVRGTKVKLLDITAISELRDEAHMSGYSIRPTQSVNDCLHWCLPGVPDSWNEILIAQI